MTSRVASVATTQEFEALLEEALSTESGEGGRPTKVEAIRALRPQVAKLRAKGVSLARVAAILGVSKDTLRKAIAAPKRGAKKKAAQAAEPRLKAAGTVAAPPAGAKGFPTDDRF